MMTWREQLQQFDQRRDLVIPGDRGATLHFCVEQWIEVAQESIAKRDAFYVALSGGSTPKVIYKALAHNQEKIDWNKVYLFWSDERCVPPTDPESNYKMAMDNGFSELPIPTDHIFRMKGELPPEESALEYNTIIKENVQSFDLIMLGMGDDGHTASLFPKTHALHTTNRLVVANHIPQKNAWRLTLTYNCINNAKHISIYVLGKDKAETLKNVLSGPSKPDLLPSQQIGTPTHKALWIVDDEASTFLRNN